MMATLLRKAQRILRHVLGCPPRPGFGSVGAGVQVNGGYFGRAENIHIGDYAILVRTHISLPVAVWR